MVRQILEMIPALDTVMPVEVLDFRDRAAHHGAVQRETDVQHCLARRLQEHLAVFHEQFLVRRQR